MQAPSSMSHDVFSALTAGLHFNPKLSHSQATSQQIPLAGHKRKRDVSLGAPAVYIEAVVAHAIACAKHLSRNVTC